VEVAAQAMKGALNALMAPAMDGSDHLLE